ncbi:MAG: MgtC/SapB family protein [Eubacteriales bacterium]|nr:MgtC/SapB family protein [Eubacteriales bacterium]
MTLIEYFNGQFSIMQNLDFVARILLACFCGACIGFERSKRFKEAGIRTHVIVCCASALIMIVSKYGFADLTDADGIVFNGTRGADPARVAAQVVSGISFLGAGVIFKNGSTVKGLTTAAGIWATAGIGLALGCGMYFTGIFVTLMIGIFQVATHRFTVGADSFTTNRLRFTVREDEEFEPQVRAQLQNWEAQILSSSITRRDDGLISYDLTLKMTRSISIDDVDTLMQRCHAVTSAEGIPVG